MEKTDLIFYIAYSASATFSFLWAFFGLFKKKRGLYYSLITLTLTGTVISEYFNVIYLLSGGDTFAFSIGSLGSASSMLFYIFANEYFLSKLVDPELKVSKGRKAAPYLFLVACAAADILLFCSDVERKYLSIPILCLFTAVPAGFTAFKYVFMPDVKGGFIDVMRPMNVAYAVLICMAVMNYATWSLPESVLYSPVYLVPVTGTLILSIGAIGPLLKRGTDKWRT